MGTGKENFLLIQEGKMLKIGRFTDKFLMAASEELRNFYMNTFKFVFSAKYRKRSHLLDMHEWSRSCW